MEAVEELGRRELLKYLRQSHEKSLQLYLRKVDFVNEIYNLIEY